MRPVAKGAKPTRRTFTDYAQAKPDLISRLGAYCSFCERKIATLLAVEHIQPKALAQYSHLILEWRNFLLACTNCNSTKLNKNVVLSNLYFPDRDNTFYAFVYTEDGKVSHAPHLSPAQQQIAQDTLALTGLDKDIAVFTDENDKQIAIDRVAQRKEVWLQAQEAQQELNAQPNNLALKKIIVVLAQSTGFFSIWMNVFQTNPDMRNRLIDAFPGTRASGCFTPTTAQPISPAPNPDGLSGGGKI